MRERPVRRTVAGELKPWPVWAGWTPSEVTVCRILALAAQALVLGALAWSVVRFAP